MPAPKAPGEPFRPNLYVVARFLDALVEGPRTRAELQAAAGVNYDIFRRYLDLLAERDHLRVHADGTVAMTVAGRRVRAELRAWIEAFLAPPREASGPRARNAPADDGPRSGATGK